MPETIDTSNVRRCDSANHDVNNTAPMHPLRHVYFGMRHGFSRPNSRGVVVAQPEIGVLPDNALHEKGRQQAATVDLSPVIRTDLPVVIVASPFARTRETAEIVHSRLPGTPEPHLDMNLRERGFGDFEGQSDTNYNKIWASDATKGASNTDYNCESANSVRHRTLSVVDRLEKMVQEPSAVILVSHGDSIQILQTAFEGMDASEHRLLPTLPTAGLRQLGRALPA